MKTLFLIPILWILSLSINAQVNLKGTVQDSLGKAMPFVSVAILKTDSSLVKATCNVEYELCVWESESESQSPTQVWCG